MLLGDRFSILLTVALLGAFSIADAQTSQSDNRPRTASISGRVTVSGKPVANAKIVITEIKNRSELASQGGLIELPGLNAGENYGVLTDVEGRYRMTNLPAGRYEAQAMLKDCVREKRSRNDAPVESFSLNEGESHENLDFILVRGGVITGRAIDADGRPLIATIITLQAVIESGQKAGPKGLQDLMDMGNFHMFQTDDRGIYRLYGLRAGRYLVSAGGDSNKALNTLTGAGGEYPRTWHPDATVENQAKIIEVEAGGEVTGVDIRMDFAKRTYEVSGRVVDDETGKPIIGANVIFDKIKGSDEAVPGNTGGFRGNAKSDGQGNFSLGGLSPGQYWLNLADQEPDLAGAGSDHYSDGTKVEVQSADVASVEIRAKRGVTISGVAVIEDADPSARQILSRMMIMAQSRPLPPNGANQNENASELSPPISRIGSDGGFMLKGIRPGAVTLDVYGMTGNPFKLLRVERGGAQVSDGIVVTGREDITGVRVILGKGSGVIRGQVNVIGGALPEGYQMDVTAERIKDSISGDFNDAGRADKEGRFVIEGLLPGEWVLTLVLIPPRRLDNLLIISPEPVIQRLTLAKGQEARVIMTLDLSKKN